MGKITYATGIAILQFIVFPFILAASIFVWKRTGWRVGAKIWRYPAVLSLLRIAGSIASFIAVNDPTNANVQTTIAVCELIGIAPLVLTFVGLLRQIDYERKLPPRPLFFVTLVAIIALILAIAGVTTADKSVTYTPGTLAKVAMGLFLAVFVVVMLISGWLYVTLSPSLLRYQKKLFLAIALSAPFLCVRMIYSALADYTSIDKFKLGADETVYLCMSVLEEIVANVITLAFGISAVLQPDFVKLDPKQMKEEQHHPDEGKPLSAEGYNTVYNGGSAAYNPNSAYGGPQNVPYDTTYPAQNATYNPAYDGAQYGPAYSGAPAPAYHGTQQV